MAHVKGRTAGIITRPNGVRETGFLALRRRPGEADGHFWARATVNGVPRRMLVDSGATVTALSQRTADRAGVDEAAGLMPVILRTANGTVPARTGTVARLTLGRIEARDLPVVVSPALGDVDVLGMNFLSQLASWRVEGRTLILVPPGAQGAPAPEPSRAERLSPP